MTYRLAYQIGIAFAWVTFWESYSLFQFIVGFLIAMGLTKAFSLVARAELPLASRQQTPNATEVEVP